MDILLSSVTQQAMNYAIRSGISITGGFAIRECGRLLKSTPKSSGKEELLDLQSRLESKIRIISPAIDMIELIAARGNTTLESAISLTKELRWEIQALGLRLADAANAEELLRRGSARAKSREQNGLELQAVITAVKRLLVRIEDAVPLINLAITTSGVSLSTKLPTTVSPSRLLQASTFLTTADSQYAAWSGQAAQVGPVYTLSLYMLFAGHAWRPHDDDDVRATTWKEVIHKAKVKLIRVPLDRLYDIPEDETSSKPGGQGSMPRSMRGEGTALEYAYHLLLIEDLDDDRVHTFDDTDLKPGPYAGINLAGIRDLIPIHEISKIFYADTGKILNIGSEGEANNPVLLLKRDIHAEPPRRMLERQRPDDDEDGMSQQSEASDEDNPHETKGTHELEDRGAVQGKLGNGHRDEQSELAAQFRRESMQSFSSEPESVDSQPSHPSWRLPLDLDPEWIALEVYNEEIDSEDETERDYSDGVNGTPGTSSCRQGSLDPVVTGALSKLNLSCPGPQPETAQTPTPGDSGVPGMFMASPGSIKTSLSLLEMLIRLTALQQFRQASHLTIEDELLNFFLEDSSTTGAGANAEYRQRVRRDARRRVGFDPYDESPIKRRGEEYLAHPRATPRPDAEWEQGSYYGDAKDDAWSSTRGTPNDIRPSIEYSPMPMRLPKTPSSPSPMLRPRPTSVHSSPGLSKSARSLFGQSPAGPPGSLKSRHAILRSQTEKPSSPLSRRPGNVKADSTLGTSPSSEEPSSVAANNF